MEKFSRRAFFRSIGLPSGSAERKLDDGRDPNESQKDDRDEELHAADMPGRFQFTLMTLLVITTAVSILLAISKIWPRRAFTVAVLTAALAERVYRKRIKSAIGAKPREGGLDSGATLCDSLRGHTWRRARIDSIHPGLRCMVTRNCGDRHRNHFGTDLSSRPIGDFLPNTLRHTASMTKPVLAPTLRARSRRCRPGRSCRLTNRGFGGLDRQS